MTKEYSGRRVAVISSRGAIRAYLLHFLGLPFSQMPQLGVNNTGISRVRRLQMPPNKSDGPPGVLVALNDTAHLEGLV